MKRDVKKEMKLRGGLKNVRKENGKKETYEMGKMGMVGVGVGIESGGAV